MPKFTQLIFKFLLFRDITVDEQGDGRMPSQSDDLKQRLQERANEAIEKLLAQKGGRRDLSMDEMEAGWRV